MTKQQRLVCAVLEQTPGHHTAEELFLLAREQMPAIALGTVYRILNQLAGEGRVRRLTVPGQPDRFDRNPEPHAHLVCRCCGGLEDLFLPELMDYLQAHCGTKISHYELTVGHTCAHCRETNTMDDTI